MHQRAVFRRWARWGAIHGPLPFIRVAPVLIGLAFALFLPKARQQVLGNLRRIFGLRGWRVESKETFLTFVRFAQCLTEGFATGRSDVDSQLEVSGDQIFDALSRSGQGAIVLTAHLGPWDSAARELRRRVSGPVVLVMEQEADPMSAKIQDDDRWAEGVSVLRLGEDPLLALPLLSHLKSGGLAAIQLDRAPQHRPALELALFGRPFPVPLGPFLLAGLGEVPLIPIFAERVGFFRRRIIVGAPVAVSRRPGIEEMTRLAQQILTQLEGRIRATPTQWFHFVPASDEPAPAHSPEGRSPMARRRLRSGASGSHLAKAPP